MKPGKIDLETLCQKLMQELYESNDSHDGIEFKAGPMPEAYGDETLIRQILNNLLTNAVKYSRGKPTRFTVERCNGDAVFRVEDRGIGIPVADQRLMFTPFHRGGNVGDAPGTGLGLVIVKRSVELHQGEIVCNTEEGRGTTFIVKLPLFASKHL
jgi:signal transduction histidine kinase